MIKQAFITGATGFIGGYIVEEFIEKGWRVAAVVHKRKSSKLEQLCETGRVKLIESDIRDFKSLHTALCSIGTRFDVIVHCAGRASDVGWRSEFRRTNLDSVRYLTQLTKDLNIPRFVFLSTTDVYGLQDFDGETEEELQLRAYPGNPYPEFKILAEKVIRKELPRNRFSIIRPAQVWGLGDTTLSARIVDFLKLSPWIVHFGKWRGQNRWPLAHVRNVALAAYLAATLPEAAGQAFNVTDNEHISIDEFYRILARIYLPKKNLENIVIPFWSAYVVSALVSGISNLLNLKSPFVDPSLYALYAVSKNLDFSNEKFRKLAAKARRSLVTLDEGIHELEQEKIKLVSD